MASTTAPPPAYPFVELFPQLRNKRIVLCSASPRRAQLLAQIGLRADAVTSGFAEDIDQSQLTPWEYCQETATQKVLHTYKKLCDDPSLGAATTNGKKAQEPDLLIAADTVVLAGHSILEKPKSDAHQLEMLKSLRDAPAGTHKVITAIAVLRPDDDMPVAPGYVLKTHIEETDVIFDSKTSDDLLLAYVRTGEGRDKAGGYGIQGQAASFVEGIRGSYDNVVGLPLNATTQLIRKVLDHSVYGDAEEEDLIDSL